MSDIREFIINKTDMDDDEFYRWLVSDHKFSNELLIDFEKELMDGGRDSETSDELYDRLTRNIKNFESKYKVKYNYKLSKLRNID